MDHHEHHHHNHGSAAESLPLTTTFATQTLENLQTTIISNLGIEPQHDGKAYHKKVNIDTNLYFRPS